jgi:hypothetical protein
MAANLSRQDIKKYWPRILELRKQGFPYRVIAEKLGLRPSYVGYHLGKLNKKAKAKEITNGISTHTNGAVQAENGTEEAAIAFAAGHCVAWLEVYAHSQQIPGAVLASRVGKLLQAGKNR